MKVCCLEDLMSGTIFILSKGKWLGGWYQV